MTLYRFGGETKIEAYTDINQMGASLAALPDGGWVITWIDDIGTLPAAIRLQQYDKLGHALLPDNYKVNTTDLFGPGNARSVVTVLADGSFVVSWTQVGDSVGTILQQRFLPNQAPSQVVLNGTPVQEGAAVGTVVGTLSGLDPNMGIDPAQAESLTYSLVDDAGGRFTLQGDKIVLANGLKLDYEQARSQTVLVRITDKDGASTTQAVAVQVADVARENLTGSNGADHFVGGADADVFRGMGGNDKLAGGLGKDTLDGGAGSDTFVFNTKASKTNVDKISFNVKDDTIEVSRAVFTKAGKVGTLKASAFHKGTKADDASDRFIYDKRGYLYYDPDGDGSAAQVKITTLNKNLNMSHKDFLITI